MARMVQGAEPEGPLGAVGFRPLEPDEAKEQLRQAASISTDEIHAWLRGRALQMTLGGLLAGALLGSSATVRGALLNVLSRFVKRK